MTANGEIDAEAAKEPVIEFFGNKVPMDTLSLADREPVANLDRQAVGVGR